MTGNPQAEAPAWVLALATFWRDLNSIELIDAAVAYAESGIPVFPLQPEGKTPYPGSRGFLDAQADPRAAESRWKRQPGSNIGIATGHAFNVLDVDAKKGARGWASLHALNRKRLLAGAFAQASTPSGGCHLLYAPRAGQGNHASGKSGTGLDFRGEGGYIVAAPSVLESGKYAWTGVEPNAYGPSFRWSEAIAALCRPSPPAAKPPIRNGSLKGLYAHVARAPQGNRNASLHWAACRAVDQGLDPWELVNAGLESGLTAAEARRTVSSALRGATR